MSERTIMSIDALFADFESLIDRVDAGETIMIERDGKIVASLVPSSDEEVVAVLGPPSLADAA